MPIQFRRKSDPVVEAIQYRGNADEIVFWANNAVTNMWPVHLGSGVLSVMTALGNIEVEEDDWIVKVHNDFSVWQSPAFEMFFDLDLEAWLERHHALVSHGSDGRSVFVESGRYAGVGLRAAVQKAREAGNA